METSKVLKCGVKYCGGCNPRYDRSQALEEIKSRAGGRVSFDYAKEDTTYDVLLVIGGCASCCASYETYKAKKGVIKMWDEACIEDICASLEEIIEMEDKRIELEANL